MAVASTSKAIKTGGDDLDDGLELDPELLAPSDGSDVEGEEVDVDEMRVDGVDEEDEVDDGDLQEDEEEPRKRAGVKRKVENLDEDAKAEEKKRRKKEKEKERKARRMAEDPTNVPKSTSATNLSAAQLSEMLLASIRETFRSATTMEIDELIIPESSLLEPLGSIPPTDDPFRPLGFRLKTLVKDVNVKKIPAATPKVIILSLSGMRCADVVRAVKPFKGTGEVAKLFAKHLKFEDQVRYLEKTKVSIAVGTPARVSKLLSEGAMKVKEGTVILLDATYKDPKQRSLLTLPEIRTELWKSLFSGKARETILNSGAKIGAF